MVVLLARDEDRAGEAQAAVGAAGTAVGVEGVAGAGPAVADEVGLGVHLDQMVLGFGSGSVCVSANEGGVAGMKAPRDRMESKE